MKEEKGKIKKKRVILEFSRSNFGSFLSFLFFFFGCCVERPGLTFSSSMYRAISRSICRS